MIKKRKQRFHWRDYQYCHSELNYGLNSWHSHFSFVLSVSLKFPREKFPSSLAPYFSRCFFFFPPLWASVSFLFNISLAFSLHLRMVKCDAVFVRLTHKFFNGQGLGSSIEHLGLGEWMSLCWSQSNQICAAPVWKGSTALWSKRHLFTENKHTC